MHYLIMPTVEMIMGEAASFRHVVGVLSRPSKRRVIREIKPGYARIPKSSLAHHTTPARAHLAPPLTPLRRGLFYEA